MVKVISHTVFKAFINEGDFLGGATKTSLNAIAVLYKVMTKNLEVALIVLGAQSLPKEAAHNKL